MPLEGLPADADLVLVQNVPTSALNRLISDQVPESVSSRAEALTRVRQFATPAAVAQVYREYRLGGRFAVAWLEPPPDVSAERCAELFPPLSSEYLATHAPGVDDFSPIWVDLVDGQPAARFVFLEAKHFVRADLSFVERAVLGLATMVFRLDALELRCIAKRLKSFRSFVNQRLGVREEQQRQVNVRSNERADAVRQELQGRFYRARAKMDATHDFDIVDVAAQDTIDLAESDRWQEFEAAQGRGRYIEFFYPNEEDRNLIRVAQRDITISFVTPATEAAVQRVKEAVLRHGERV